MDLPDYWLPRPAVSTSPALRDQFDEVLDRALAAGPDRPVAKLIVGPDDFPFLHDIHGHDDNELVARATADPDGFPWHNPVS
ncbi:MAG TPA: hypothetical protein VGD84_16330 [Pseudonocardiaceae bacterium]